MENRLSKHTWQSLEFIHYYFLVFLHNSWFLNPYGIGNENFVPKVSQPFVFSHCKLIKSLPSKLMEELRLLVQGCMLMRWESSYCV